MTFWRTAKWHPRATSLPLSLRTHRTQGGAELRFDTAPRRRVHEATPRVCRQAPGTASALAARNTCGYGRRVKPQDLERRALWLASLVACLGVVWAIWSVPLVMTNDGPEAVLTAHMEAHYDDPGSIFERQFSVGFGLSGRGFSALYRPLAAASSWPTSFRLSQLIMVLAVALGAGWLCKAVSGKASFTFLFGFAIAFCWPFYMGFFAFTISMAIGLMVLAFVVSKPDGLTIIEKAAVCTALLVQLFCHGFAIFITLALVALVVVTRIVMKRATVPRAEWRRAALGEAAWLFVAGLPCATVLVVLRLAQSELAKLPGTEKTQWATASEWAKVFPRLVVPGSTTLGIVVLLLAVLGIVRAAWRLRRGPRRPDEVALVLGATGLLVAAIATPLNIPGWQFFAPRFLTTGLVLGLSLHGAEKLDLRPAPVVLVLRLGVVALVVSVLFNARAVHTRMATACADAIVGLDHRVARTSFQLPVMFDANCGLPTDDTRADVPYSRALLHFYALFPAIHGGTVPYGFFGPGTVHAFVPRGSSPVPVPSAERYWGLMADDPRLLRPKARAGLVNDMAVFGTHYENILFFGANASDRALLLDRGYVVDFEHGSFINAHYSPCAVELETEVLEGDSPVLVRGGLRQDELWPAKIAEVAGRRAIKASIHMLCGDVWVRVRWQDSERVCANADAQGRIALHAEHGSPARLVCERK